MRILVAAVALAFALPARAQTGSQKEAPKLVLPVLTLESLPKAPDNLGELRQAMDRAMASKVDTVLTMDLDSVTLRRAAQSLTGVDMDTRNLISTLKSIQVRMFDVASRVPSNLQTVRESLQPPNWQRYSSYTSKNESVEIWSARWGTSQQGVFLLSVNGQRVFAMSVEGNIAPNQLVALSGLLGIPNFKPKLEVPLDPR